MPNTEDKGTLYVESLIVEMGFIYRDQPKHDVGIDAHIEIKDPDNPGTGRLIGVQIKSGHSHYRKNKDGSLSFNPKTRHIKYWAGHTLPVILVIYDPKLKTGWWCDLKTYFSRHPRILLSEEKTIRIPANAIFDLSSKESLVEIASRSSLALDMQNTNYSFISQKDVSSGELKRYRAEILVGPYSNHNTARLAIFHAMNVLRKTIEHKSTNHEKRWGNQPPHLIFLYVYKYVEDQTNRLLYAEALWRDRSNKLASAFKFGSQNDSTDNIEITFTNDDAQQVRRSYFAGRSSTKSEFLHKAQLLIDRSDRIISHVTKLLRQLEAGETSEEHVDSELVEQAGVYFKIERQYDDEKVPPHECQDAVEKLSGVIGSISNLFLVYTELGLTKYPKFKQRLMLLKMYLKHFESDRQGLEFEIRKLKK
jgi:hypothetical protein